MFAPARDLSLSLFLFASHDALDSGSQEISPSRSRSLTLAPASGTITDRQQLSLGMRDRGSSLTISPSSTPPAGWHAYFWLSFIPLILLFAVGTKLVHIISELAHEVAEKHSAIEGDLVVKPSDDHFWFGRPRIMIFFIHLILFHVAFEIAYFFWILATYGYHSCNMDETDYIVPKLVICVVVQIICSYSTLPLYAIVTQMGSSFKPLIFEEHVQEGLVGWVHKAKMKGKKLTTALSRRKSEETELEFVFTKDPLMDEGGHEIVEVDGSKSNHAR